MKPPAYRNRSLFLLCVALPLLVLVLIDTHAAEREPGVTAKAHDPLFIPEVGTADITFPQPQRYAIVEHAMEQIRRLYTVGDILFHPLILTRSLRIQRVDAGSLVLREPGKDRQRVLRLGDPVPDLPGVTFVGTVMLNQLQYRFKVVAHITRWDPVLVSLVGTRAVLEKEVLHLQPDLILNTAPRAAPPETDPEHLDLELIEKVRVKEIDEDTYELDAGTVVPVMENVAQVFTWLKPRFAPAFSSQTGMSLKLTSAVADGTLSENGFTVTNINVAQTLGIQVGDTITSLNGRAVNSPRNAWWTFQEIFIRHRNLRELRVGIIRGGLRMTKTFRIR